MSSEASEERTEPSPKKPKLLRSIEPDLKVILKYPCEESGEEKQAEYPMYSQVLASRSKFVDAALTVEMQEKETL